MYDRLHKLHCPIITLLGLTIVYPMNKYSVIPRLFKPMKTLLFCVFFFSKMGENTVPYRNGITWIVYVFSWENCTLPQILGTWRDIERNKTTHSKQLSLMKRSIPVAGTMMILNKFNRIRCSGPLFRWLYILFFLLNLPNIRLCAYYLDIDLHFKNLWKCVRWTVHLKI